MNLPSASLILVALHSVILLDSARAVDVTMPAIFADHMVIQTDRPIRLSGEVTPTFTALEIALAGQRVSVKPGLFGSWSATLDPVSEPGGSHLLTISADGEVVKTLENVTFGDVWLCGGQSNMEWDMTTIQDSGAEIAQADFPDIRLLEVRLLTDSKPRTEVKGLTLEWSPCSPSTVRQFSGVGFLFGREIHQSTGRPIGLVQSAWGGSRIETWIPDAALQENPYGENVLGRTYGAAQHRPSLCYNAMIHGLAPLGLRGVVWYQGESNQDHPEEYRSLHETLITSWRELWGQPDLPFYLVQLANYAPGLRWELLREAQTQTLALPHTGMAVTIDIGASNDIHPRNKQGTAHRLAAVALATTYGQDRVYSGPLFRSASRDGDTIVVHFEHVGSGLVGVDSGDSVVGFERLSASGQWSKVSATISGDTVVIPGSIFSPNPQGVRYAWSSDPVVSLANAEGFPAVPFRFEPGELSYASWKDQLVGPPAVRTAEADADGDGESNLLHYATAGERPRVSLRADGSHRLVFFRRTSALDVSVWVERSEDLVDWMEVWSIEKPNSSGLNWTQERRWGDVMREQWSVDVAGAEGPQLYYRVGYTLSQ